MRAKNAGVKPRTPFPEELKRLARQQALVVSREQVLKYGTDRVIGRWLGEGRLAPVTRGIYALGDGGWRQQAWAGILLGGRDAVLGLSSAAHLDGLIKEAPSQVTVFVGPTARIQRDVRWRFITAARQGVRYPRRTPASRTIVDLAGELPPDALAALVSTAIGRRLATPETITAMLASVKRHPCRALLSEIAADSAVGVRSALERRYLRDVERAHGLPSSKRQQGPLSMQTDVWYEEYGVIVELDGRPYHDGVAAWNDLDRDNQHRLKAQITLRYPWTPVAVRPCKVMTEVVTALRQQGWPGRPQRCPRCPTSLAPTPALGRFT